MEDRHGKAVLIKFGNSGAFANHVNDFLRINHERDTSFKALALTKIQRQSCTTQEMRIHVQVDSDNLQNLEQGFLIDDNITDFVLFYKAKERSTSPNFPADLAYLFSLCFYKKLTDFNPNRI